MRAVNNKNKHYPISPRLDLKACFRLKKHLQMTGVCTYTAALYWIVPISVYKLVGVLKVPITPKCVLYIVHSEWWSKTNTLWSWSLWKLKKHTIFCVGKTYPWTNLRTPTACLYNYISLISVLLLQLWTLISVYCSCASLK